MPHSIDTSVWPLVRFNVEGAISCDEVASMHRGLEDAVFARKERFVILVDARGFQPGRRLAQEWGQWLKKHIETIRTYGLGTALVNDSTLFRFRMSALFLVQPLPHAYTISGSLEDAEWWAFDLLRREGLLPDAAAVG